VCGFIIYLNLYMFQRRCCVAVLVYVYRLHLNMFNKTYAFLSFETVGVISLLNSQQLVIDNYMH
jgi:hypothetical protein